MSSHRYRKLLTNLPSMAAVVNTFESQEVQMAVFQRLAEAFDEATNSSDDPRNSQPEGRQGNHRRNGESHDETLADVIEGDSIHSMSEGE